MAKFASRTYFKATTPNDEVIAKSQHDHKQPPLHVIVGYSQGILGALHWTANSSEAYHNRVIANNLATAKKYGIELAPDDIHILPVTPVDECPQNLVTAPNFVSNSVPKRSLAQQITDLRAEARGEWDLEIREPLEAKLAKLTLRRDAEIAACEAMSDTPEVAAYEPPSTSSRTPIPTKTHSKQLECLLESVVESESFESEKYAKVAAKGRCLKHVDNVLRDPNNADRWIVVE